MDSLNDEIFEKIKGIIGGSSGPESLGNPAYSDLLYKICSGQATEIEKEEWNQTMGIDEKKIKESCDFGYDMAAKLDNDPSNPVKMREEIEELKFSLIEMKKEIDDLKSEVRILQNQERM